MHLVDLMCSWAVRPNFSNLLLCSTPSAPGVVHSADSVAWHVVARRLGGLFPFTFHAGIHYSFAVRSLLFLFGAGRVRRVLSGTATHPRGRKTDRLRQPRQENDRGPGRTQERRLGWLPQVSFLCLCICVSRKAVAVFYISFWLCWSWCLRVSCLVSLSLCAFSLFLSVFGGPCCDLTRLLVVFCQALPSQRAVHGRAAETLR